MKREEVREVSIYCWGTFNPNLLQSIEEMISLHKSELSDKMANITFRELGFPLTLMDWLYMSFSRSFSKVGGTIYSIFSFSLFIIRMLLLSSLPMLEVSPIWIKISSKYLKSMVSPMKWSDIKTYKAHTCLSSSSIRYLIISESSLAGISSNSLSSISWSKTRDWKIDLRDFPLHWIKWAIFRIASSAFYFEDPILKSSSSSYIGLTYIWGLDFCSGYCWPITSYKLWPYLSCFFSFPFTGETLISLWSAGSVSNCTRASVFFLVY